MTIVKNKGSLLGMLVLLSVFALGGTPAFAASIVHTTNDTKDVCADLESADDEPEGAGGNEALDENDAEDTCEQVESVKLAKIVAVSEAHARHIAETNYSGNGKITELLLARDEDEHNVSRIVYEIEFTESDKTQVDVKVDANTGKYLGVDMEDDEDGNNIEHVKGSANVQALQMQLMDLLQQLISLQKV